jgi:hypothetical protein
MTSTGAALATLALLLIPFPAAAIDPGTARGEVRIGGERVPLKHAYAHLHVSDQRSGIPKPLRIVIAERELPQSALAGAGELPVVRMAAEGKVRGLLVQVDPNDRGSAAITLLYGPADRVPPRTTPGAGHALRKLSIAHNRVQGEVEIIGSGPAAPRAASRIAFSAPLFQSSPRSK